MMLSTGAAVRAISASTRGRFYKALAAAASSSSTGSSSTAFSSLTGSTCSASSSNRVSCCGSASCGCVRCRQLSATAHHQATAVRSYSSTILKAEASTTTATATLSSITSNFPKAVPNSTLITTLTTALETKHGYTSANTLVATSLCADEVSRTLESSLAQAYSMPTFSMGGLAGFPFGGITAFGAMSSHIPDGGSTLVVFAPHVGVDSSGAVGTVERRGRSAGGACCGSAVAATAYVSGVHSGSVQKHGPPDTALDAQQNFVGTMLLPYAAQLEKADDKMVYLPYAVYDAQKQMMDDIVSAASGAVAGKGKIAVLGGVQINTPPVEGEEDYFLPLSLEVYDNTGTLVEDMSEEIGCGSLPAGIGK